MGTSGSGGRFATICISWCWKKSLMELKFRFDKLIGQRQNSSQAQAPPPMPASCKHPQVRVVAREEDVELVECQLCGAVFGAAELVDIWTDEEEPAESHDEA